MRYPSCSCLLYDRDENAIAVQVEYDFTEHNPWFAPVEYEIIHAVILTEIPRDFFPSDINEDVLEGIKLDLLSSNVQLRCKVEQVKERKRMERLMDMNPEIKFIKVA